MIGDKEIEKDNNAARTKTAEPNNEHQCPPAGHPEFVVQSHCYVTRGPARKEEQERQSRPAKSGGLSTDARPSRLSPSRGFEIIEIIEIIEGGKGKGREINK